MIELEKYLVTMRGWALRQPKGEAAIILMSGGLDSSVLAEVCLQQLQVELVPIYIKRGAHAEYQELHATKQVVRYLRYKYPNKVKPLRVIAAAVPPTAISKAYAQEAVRKTGLPLRNMVLASIAVQYAAASETRIRTIILCLEKFLPEGTEYPDMSLRSMLANTIAVGSNMDDWDWQVMSPLLIPGLLPDHQYVTKQELVRWATKQDFPLHLTYSCTTGGQVPCDECRSCVARQKVLSNVKV